MNLSDLKHLTKYRKNINLSQSKLSEIANITQFRLSQFEHNKIELTQEEKKQIIKILNDKKLLNKVITRRKRYQKHTYENNIINKSRRRSYKRSLGNKEFINDLNSIYKKHSESEKKLSCISLFSGCGGFSLGASAAGFKIKGFLELEKSAVEIYKKNFHSSELLGLDINDIKLEIIKKKFQNKIDLVIGGPPCQGFSLAGKRDAKDERNYLYKKYLDLVLTIKPKIFIMENVELLLSMKNNNGTLIKDDIIKDFSNKNYSVDYKVINASNFGVPQNRKRVIFFGIQKEINKKIIFPEKIFSDEKNNLFNSFKKIRSFSDAVSDLPYLESGQSSNLPFHQAQKHPDHVLKWLWNVKEGKSAHENKQKELRPPSGYNTTYKRQIWNNPASTVQTTFGMISGSNNVHPICTRALTIREAARIQSFPDKFVLTGKIGSIRTAIGNAVPPLLSYELCNYFKNYIL